MVKTKVKNTKNMNRGVFATQPFSKNQIVESSPCLTWNVADNGASALQDTFLRFYVFEGATPRVSVLALGVGSLFNHSSTPNVKYEYNSDRNIMVFKATRAIKAGEQLFVDYGYDPVQELRKWELFQMKKEDPIKAATVEMGIEMEKQMFDPTGDDGTVRLVGLSEQLAGDHRPFWDENKSLGQKIKEFFKSIFKQKSPEIR